jgi:ATP-binding cassette subfamily F protein uup
VPVLTATGLTRSFGPHVVLSGVDLSIHQGEHVGLVGANGSGKSTLSRILAGIDPPDTGELAVRRGARVQYLAQEPVLDATRNVLETVLDGLGPWSEAKRRYDAASHAIERGENLTQALEAQARAMADLEHHGGFDITHRAESVLHNLGVHELNARVDALSGGEKRRVALARVLVSEPELAILDEPTNHLDIDAIEWLELHLADQFKGAVLLITHDRYFLDAVVDRTLEIERGKLYSYDGGFADYLEGRAARVELAERTEKNRQNFLRRELDWLRRSPPARTTKQQARIERAQQALSNRPAPQAQKLDLSLDAARGGKTILDLHDVCIDTLGDAQREKRRLITGLTLHMTQGERLGILGPNGSGKSTLLKAILGEHPLASGHLTLGKNARIAYLSQHRTGLDDDRSILDNVADGRSHVRVGDKDVHAISYLEQFLFKSADVRKKVSALSGGERTRVALAKLLLNQTSLLLLDEPTNDLDLDTLAALEDLLLEHEITTLVVTHDRWFLDRIATSILLFQGEGRVVRYAGNFSDVRAAREASKKAEKAEAPAKPSAPPSAATPKGKKPGLSYKEQRELEQIEPQIEALEGRIAELDALLADGSIYQTRAAEVPALVAERDSLRGQCEGLMERWAELEEKRENG